MTDAELCWLAGLLEGEGSFCKGPPSRPNSLQVSLQMTDEDVVARAANLFGVAYSRGTPKKKAWKYTYRTLLRGYPAAALMKQLRPMMGQRRQGQIDRALASYDPRLAERRRNMGLPVIEELDRLHQEHSFREMGRMFKCDHRTIARRLQVWKALGNVA